MRDRRIARGTVNWWPVVAIVIAGLATTALLAEGVGADPPPEGPPHVSNPAAVTTLGAAAVLTTTTPTPSATATGTVTVTSTVTTTLSPGPTGSPPGTAPPTGYRAYLPLVVKLEPTPPPTPTATATATTVPVPAWLARINALRALGNLPSLAENPEWSAGCGKHAIYMLKNQDFNHGEDSSKPFYTKEGYDAAVAAEYYFHDNVDAPDQAAVDWWMSGPFHVIPVLDPRLTTTGFGSARESVSGKKMTACLDVLRGRGSVPSPAPYPIKWPADNQVTPLRTYTGSEYPDPLATCTGYTVPSGLPITLQVGAGGTTLQVTAHSLKRDGVDVDHCVFQGGDYTHPDAGTQASGRATLGSRDAVVVMPREPLAPGSTYSVSLTVNGRTYAWSFKAGS